MSTGIYAGSMQFVTINLLSTGASIITTAIMTLMVNIRHLFYGITMLEKYSEAGWRKPYLIFSLTDETYSLICSPDLPDDINRKDYFFIVSLVNQLSWIAGSIIGDYSLVIAPVVADLCTTPVALSAPPNSYQNNSQS